MLCLQRYLKNSGIGEHGSKVESKRELFGHLSASGKPLVQVHIPFYRSTFQCTGPHSVVASESEVDHIDPLHHG